MSPPGAHCVNAGVESSGRLQAFVIEQLPDQIKCARIDIKVKFRGDMAKLVRSHSYSKLPQYRPNDRALQSYLRSRLAGEGDKHRIGTRAGHGGSDFIAINQ